MKIKKLLLTLICTTAVSTSYAEGFSNNVGSVPLLAAETADVYCHYMGNATILLGKVSGNKKTINNVAGFELSQSSNFTLCPISYANKFLDGLIVKSDGNYLPIFYSDLNKTPNDELNPLINGYYLNYINMNLDGTLNSLLSSEEDFTQYQKDYTRSALQIKLPDNVNIKTIHDAGKSDIYAEMPNTADEAIVGLKLFIMQNSGKFTNADADLIGTFLVRYDNQSAMLSVGDMLIGFSSAYPLIPLGSEAPAVLVELKKETNGNIILKYIFTKLINRTISVNGLVLEKPYLLKYELPLTIKKGSTPVKMQIVFAKKSPFSSVKLLDSTGTKPLNDDFSKTAFMDSLPNAINFMAADYESPDSFKTE